MALPDVEVLEPTRKKRKRTTKKPKAKPQKNENWDKKEKREWPGREYRRCARCKSRLKKGHVVEHSGKEGSKPKLYCLNCA